MFHTGGPDVRSLAHRLCGADTPVRECCETFDTLAGCGKTLVSYQGIALAIP
jgi:hypothetical protein